MSTNLFQRYENEATFEFLFPAFDEFYYGTEKEQLHQQVGGCDFVQRRAGSCEWKVNWDLQKQNKTIACFRTTNQVIEVDQSSRGWNCEVGYEYDGYCYHAASVHRQ